MRIIYKSPVVAGVYLTDNPHISTEQKNSSYWITSPTEQRFLPILTLIDLKPNAEFKFAKASSQFDGESIETYNRSASGYDYSKEVVNYTKLDVTANDLTIGPQSVLLNFLDRTVVSKSSLDIPKMFGPLKNTQLSDYSGKVFLFNFYSFNAPEVVKNTLGLANYFKSLRDEMKKNQECNETKEMVLEYLARCWDGLKVNRPNAIVSNSVKVCLAYEYTLADFNHSSNVDEPVFCSTTNLTLQLTNTILDIPQHPKLGDDLISNREIINSMREHGVTCFIVDNNVQIGDRFINFAGNIRTIPKIRDINRIDGLYLISIDANKEITVDSFVPLAELDKNKYIFRSQEEAQSGTDVRQKAVNDQELRKLELSNTTVELQRSLQEKVHLLTLQSQKDREEFARRERENSEEYERRRREDDLTHQAQMKALQVEITQAKTQHERNKFQFDYAGMDRKNYYEDIGLYRKNHYEAEKYERDSTVETLKTVGSVAGLLAGGYVLYKQLSK